MKLRSRAARRYARALHDIAAEASVLDAVSVELKSLQRSLAASPELRAFVDNYLLPSDARERVLTELFSQRLHPLVWRFVRFLESKRRLGLLAEICADYLEQEEARQGIVRGDECIVGRRYLDQAGCVPEVPQKRRVVVRRGGSHPVVQADDPLAQCHHSPTVSQRVERPDHRRHDKVSESNCGGIFSAGSCRSIGNHC